MHTVLVTGANRGIGLEFVQQYAQEGWNVIACCRNPDMATKLHYLSGQYPKLIQTYALDVVNHEQIDALSKILSTATLDLLINNAGIYPSGKGDEFGSTDYDAWQCALEVNTMAPLKMTEAFIQQIARSQLKTIAIITSKMGSIADNSGGGSYIYRSSKAAVNIVTKSLSIDLKPQQIKAVVLHPGWVKTDMGGPNALITTEQSVTGMRRVINQLKMEDSGNFFAYDGQIVPW
ncbi:MAG TPA: SDR family oxidoreductase [Nitrosomonas sp.]|nr:SDR family oxidoreductase [Nitrosomonas sp.]HQX13900.1 SDR family oxidoreductase [Nitrosomonas sp.]HRB20796.1 SDR family oxidoreductase [Nitrosomonas sp.]HRB33477.1 SDR family oxidoreductase [Nitrosomonas sp.]HRB46097.1 SDR family oxidoreductase [Nitrosomonas sp.]